MRAPHQRQVESTVVPEIGHVRLLVADGVLERRPCRKLLNAEMSPEFAINTTIASVLYIVDNIDALSIPEGFRPFHALLRQGAGRQAAAHPVRCEVAGNGHLARQKEES